MWGKMSLVVGVPSGECWRGLVLDPRHRGGRGSRPGRAGEDALRRPHMPFPLSGMRAPGWAPCLRRGTRWKALMPSHLLAATHRTLSCFSSSFSVPPNVLPSLSASSAFPARSTPPRSRAAAPPGTHMCFVISERTAESGPEEACHVGLNQGTARACFTTCEALSHSVCYSSFMIALCGAHSREIGALGYSRRR